MDGEVMSWGREDKKSNRVGCRGQNEINVNLILIKKLSKKGKAKGDVFKKTKSKKKEQS